MENDPDNQIPPRLALYHGVVTDIADPLKIGRVRVRVPGIVDESDWAFPLSMARGRGRGFFDVPDPGAEVGVWWLAGSPDRPYYVPGNYVAPRGAGQAGSVMEDVSPGDANKVKFWETSDHLILLDARDGAFEIRDKVTGDGFAYDRTTMSLEIKGTVSVKITSTGAVDIDALSCTILGRPVVPGAGPIR